VTVTATVNPPGRSGEVELIDGMIPIATAPLDENGTGDVLGGARPRNAHPVRFASRGPVRDGDGVAGRRRWT
jgi:hypothetical protein